MDGLRASMIKSQMGSPDRHHEGVSKADVPSSGVGNTRVSGLGSIRSCASGGWLGRRLFQHGSLTLRVTACRAELCLKNGIEDPPWRQRDETIAEIVKGGRH